jgi:hypothetical protein
MGVIRGSVSTVSTLKTTYCFNLEGIGVFTMVYIVSRSQWPGGLRRGSAAIRFAGIAGSNPV